MQLLGSSGRGDAVTWQWWKGGSVSWRFSYLEVVGGRVQSPGDADRESVSSGGRQLLVRPPARGAGRGAGRGRRGGGRGAASRTRCGTRVPNASVVGRGGRGPFRPLVLWGPSARCSSVARRRFGRPSGGAATRLCAIPPARAAVGAAARATSPRAVVVLAAAAARPLPCIASFSRARARRADHARCALASRLLRAGAGGAIGCFAV
jgi:hypothetical protein